MRTCCILFLVYSFPCKSQINTHYISPNQTDNGYSKTQDSSTVSISTNVRINKLFLFIGGTGSSSSKAYTALRLHAAKLGFDFINLSYPNNIAAATLSKSNDSLVFDNYRQEICFGTPLSDTVFVDSLNSIYTRTLKLIQHLNLAYPQENWGQYLTASNSINWSKVIVGGHSQGAGHAAYLAKQFLVDRVLMYSGPNDYSNYFLNAANWLRQKGITPITKHFVYLGLKDEIVDFSKQLVNLSGLGIQAYTDTIHVDVTSSPYNNSQLLYTTQSPGIALLNHSAPIKLSSINSDVWTYMLTSTGPNSLIENKKRYNFSVFPNPTSSIVRIKSTQKIQGKIYGLYNIKGKLTMSKEITRNDPIIDLSELKSGIYFLSIDNYITKIIRQ